MRLIVRILVLLLLFPTWAFAFSLFPEFRGIQPRDAAKIDSPTRLNSEYSSDYLTYLPPMSWEPLFWKNPNAFELSTGSLSSEEFQIRDRLKLHHWILEDRLQFRFTYFAERDLEIDQDHKILELVLKLNSYVALSAYGETSLFKSEDDIGFALLFQPNDLSEHRLFYSMADFSRNERNLATDKYSKSPRTYGLVGRHFEGDWFFAYAFTNSPQLIWEFPIALRVYEAQEWLGEIEVRQEKGGGAGLGFKITADDFFESERPQAGGSINDSSLRRKRILTRIENVSWLGPHRLRLGVTNFYRDYKINQDRVMLRDTLPYVGFSLIDRHYEAGKWLNEVSIESTYHKGSESVRIMPSPLKDQSEYRLNWRTAFEIKKQGELALLLTFDLDEFGSGRTWEGGNAQFRFWF